MMTNPDAFCVAACFSSLARPLPSAFVSRDGPPVPTGGEEAHSSHGFRVSDSRSKSFADNKSFAR